MAELMARMGEYVLSKTGQDTLCALGLGSCIGVAVLDRRLGVAGLAHVVLPGGDGKGEPPGKYADRAVPLMVDELVAMGARRSCLEAVMAGGASMFASSSGNLEVGARNDKAVREVLAKLRIPVLCAVTGGSRGRTVRVYMNTLSATVREAGGTEQALLASKAARRPAA
jgi:chemotaxis protein CheD